MPASWEKGRGGILDAYDGVAWYRCRFFLPESWKEDALIFDLGRPDDRYVAVASQRTGENLADERGIVDDQNLDGHAAFLAFCAVARHW